MSNIDVVLVAAEKQTKAVEDLTIEVGGKMVDINRTLELAKSEMLRVGADNTEVMGDRLDTLDTVMEQLIVRLESDVTDLIQSIGSTNYTRVFKTLLETSDNPSLTVGTIFGVHRYSMDLPIVKHYRVVEGEDDGSGFVLDNGLFANLVVGEDKVLRASHLGLSEGVDYLDYFNNHLAAKIKNDGVTSLILDTGDITVDGTLYYDYSRLTIGGDGELLTNAIDNMLQRISAPRTNKRRYYGGINGGFVHNDIVRGAIRKKEIRIVLLGDSISVSPDYRSLGDVPDGFRNTRGVDNFDKHNCLGAQIYSEFLRILPPNIDIRFYSRSIGGLSYGNLDSAWDSIGGLFEGREQATPGKSWRDCVLDLNPDLIIHSMGMNESPSSYIDNFYNKWSFYITDVLKDKSFDQALLTTPNPNFHTAEQFGDFRQYSLNASKFWLANYQRLTSSRKGYTLIDVGFHSYMKRYGVDTRNWTFNKDSIPLIFVDGGTTSKVISRGSGSYNTECTPKTQPPYYSLTVVLNSSTDSDVAGFDFKIKLGDIIIQFAGGKVVAYTNIFGGSTLGVRGKSANFKLSAETNYTFNISLVAGGINVYADDILIISYNEPYYNTTLPIYFENPSSGQPVTVVLADIREASFPTYAVDTQSNGEMYGDLAYQNNKYGGGINHPSTIGLSEVYLPPVTEFINSLLTAQTNYSEIIGGTFVNDVVLLGRINRIPYNVVTLTELGSDLDLKVSIGEDGNYTVVNCTHHAGVSIYIDPDDLSVILINTVVAVTTIRHTGDWLSKQWFNYGDKGITRGDLIPTT